MGIQELSAMSAYGRSASRVCVYLASRNNFQNSEHRHFGRAVTSPLPMSCAALGAPSRHDVLSSPGEVHPEALPEPYLSLSTHTAPMVKTSLRCRAQSTRSVGCRSSSRSSHSHARVRCRRSFLYFRQAQRTNDWPTSRSMGRSAEGLYRP
jgi:hypothetical protein